MMLAAPIPENDAQRLEALRVASCAYVPREERFDRITRTAKRLLGVPIALVSIVEQDEQWFRSVQGLEVDYTSRDISFCGHAVASNQPVCIPDTLCDLDFMDNPLVTGPPGIRSYLGWPLEISPGVAVGTLCVIDTVPRTFDAEDHEAMKDLARMAEAELKISAAVSNLQSRLLMQLSVSQRKGAMDPLTGCWNIRGFRELLALGFDDARKQGADLVLCCMQINNLEAMAADHATNLNALIQALAQALRQRLPAQGSLARLGPSSFCAFIPCQSLGDLGAELTDLTLSKVSVDLLDQKRVLDLSLSVEVLSLSEVGLQATSDDLWGRALAISSRLS